MGLIHHPRKLDVRCSVHDLSCLIANQTLLTDHIHGLLRLPARMVRPLQYTRPRPPRHASGEGYGSEVSVASFQSFTNIPLEQHLSFDALETAYREQYLLVERAILVGEERRRRSRVHERMSRNQTAPSLSPGSNVDFSLTEAELAELEERSQAALGIALRRKTPDQIHQLLAEIKRLVEPGDIIDIAGYRGSGYYLVVANDRTQGFVTEKTVGQYGCYLPPTAWPYVAQYGPEFFESADVWACYLPIETSVCLPDDQSEQISVTEHATSENEFMFSWLYQSETIEINGNSYTGEVFKRGNRLCIHSQ